MLWCVVMCEVLVYMWCVCGVCWWCVVKLGTRNTPLRVCRFKTPSCVRSERLCVYRQHARMCSTHGVSVLSVSLSLALSLSCSLSLLLYISLFFSCSFSFSFSFSLFFLLLLLFLFFLLFSPPNTVLRTDQPTNFWAFECDLAHGSC